MRLGVTNGKIVTPAGVLDGAMVSEDGVISYIGTAAGCPRCDHLIDANGHWVLPGVIDPHVHIGTASVEGSLDALRIGWLEDSRGAVHKGVTTILSFQGGSPIPMDAPHVPMLEQHIQWAEEVSYADFGFHAIMQSPEHIREQRDLASRGVVGFKHFYTAYKPGREQLAERIAIGYTDDAMLFESFENLAGLRAEGAHVLGMVHAEDADICALSEARVRATGRRDLAAWAEARPGVACIARSAAAAEIARATGCPLYIVHVSTATEVELLRRLRAAGYPVCGEACMSYLTHTQDMEREVGSYPKVIPPIRSAADRAALWRGLVDGTLETLGTDHVAWTKMQKEGRGGQFDNIWEALPGLSGLECLLPVVVTLGVQRRLLSMPDVARICSENPARRFGLYPRKGVLEVGSDADFLVVDTETWITIDDNYYQGLVSDWSIYHGWRVCGVPRMTVSRGDLMVENGEIVGDPGHGRCVL